MPDAVKVSGSLYLAPLVSLVGRGEGALVVVVGRERGDLYRLRAGRLEEIVEQHDETPGRHDQGGWSQARYQRHIEKLVHDHLKEVAELVDERLRRLRGPRVIVVASEETRSEFEDVAVERGAQGDHRLDERRRPRDAGRAARGGRAAARAVARRAGDRGGRALARGGRPRTAAPPPAGARPSRRPRTAGSSCSSSRTAPTGRPGSARPAGASGSRAAPVRSTGRRWSSAKRASTSPCTRRSPTAARCCALRQRQDLEPVEGIGALLRF